MGHHKWLDHFCEPFGFTYTALKRRVETLEAEAESQALAQEDQTWRERLEKSLVWGALPTEREITLPLPDSGVSQVPWPNCFAGTCLFSVSETGPRAKCCGPVFNIDNREIHFEGEELTVSIDQTLLMAFIMAARGLRCGALVECGVYKSQADGGRCLPDVADTVAPIEITRTLWRLSNCRLAVDEYGFDGPVLAYADARRAPEHISFAFNPAFANFYFPNLLIFKQMFQ